jgi:hypothetical protein
MLQTLEQLSDFELLSRLKRSAEKERILIYTVIAHNQRQSFASRCLREV